MDLITKHMFFTNYITFSKGDNSLKNNRILMISFLNIQRTVMKLFCSWSSSHLFIPEEQIGKNWFSWWPSWIFGGHFEFFFGQHLFLKLNPMKYICAKFHACFQIWNVLASPKLAIWPFVRITVKCLYSNRLVSYSLADIWMGKMKKKISGKHWGVDWCSFVQREFLL